MRGVDPVKGVLQETVRQPSGHWQILIQVVAALFDLRSGDFGELILPRESILMELKFTGGAPLWLARLLSENGVRPASFSKYGTYYKALMGQAPTYGNYWQEVRHYA